jgi:plastocyanin
MRNSIMRRVVSMVVVGVALAVAYACGGGGGSPTSPSGGGSGGGTGGGTGGSATATITISASGVVSPQDVTITQGGRVTFVNNDSRAHDMASDPHPSHEDCPPLDQVGFVSPGQSKTSGNLNTVRVCGYHDHNLPTSTGLQGRITVTPQ